MGSVILGDVRLYRMNVSPLSCGIEVSLEIVSLISHRVFSSNIVLDNCPSKDNQVFCTKSFAPND